MDSDYSEQKFQPKTNEFISYLIERKDDYLVENDEESVEDFYPYDRY